MNELYDELKNSIIQKIHNFQKIRQIKQSPSTEVPQVAPPMENQEGILDIGVEKLMFLGLKTAKEENVLLRFNLGEHQLELHFPDREKEDGKEIFCKIDFPFNDNLVIQYDQAKMVFKIYAPHFRAYKKNVSKKGNHWEKVNIWTFSIFRNFEKKSTPFKFIAVVH